MQIRVQRWGYFEWLFSAPVGELQSAVGHARHFASFPIYQSRDSPLENVLAARGAHYGLCVPTG